jgi:hypothetical protein
VNDRAFAMVQKSQVNSGAWNIMEQENLAYHSQRALSELHLGLTSASIGAARSHLQLSSLHMEKVLEMRGPGVRTRPICIVD